MSKQRRAADCGASKARSTLRIAPCVVTVHLAKTRQQRPLTILTGFDFFIYASRTELAKARRLTGLKLLVRPTQNSVITDLESWKERLPHQILANHDGPEH